MSNLIIPQQNLYKDSTERRGYNLPFKDTQEKKVYMVYYPVRCHYFKKYVRWASVVFIQTNCITFFLLPLPAQHKRRGPHGRSLL